MLFALSPCEILCVESDQLARSCLNLRFEVDGSFCPLVGIHSYPRSHGLLQRVFTAPGWFADAFV